MMTEFKIKVLEKLLDDINDLDVANQVFSETKSHIIENINHIEKSLKIKRKLFLI